MNLRDLIKYFIEHRHEVVIRRTQFDLRKAKERAHILEGLIIASDNIDEVIRIIRAAKTPNDAITGLIERFNPTEIQGSCNCRNAFASVNRSDAGSASCGIRRNNEADSLFGKYSG